MADFLTTHGTAYELENIITTARKRLVLISPYLQLSKTLDERMRDADRRGVRITLLYGKSRLSHLDLRAARELRQLTIYYLENLHAKCYFNEARMVITSMNLYEFSEKTNREMGMLLTSEEPAYRAAIAEVDSMIAAAESEVHRAHDSFRGHEPAERFRRVREGTRPGRRSGEQGHCIRCGRGIPFEPELPYCDHCLQVWSQFENERYPERVCHACGSDADTSMAKPLCYRCFRQEGF